MQEFETILEVAQPESAPESIVVSRTPFLIGRGSDTGNHLVLEDPRISRRCAVIEEVDGGYLLKDRGHRPGIWVNERRIVQIMLTDGDTIELGLENGPKIVFRRRPAEHYVESMLTRLGSLPAIETAAGTSGLSKLNLLLEATSLLHSALPLESVLGTMLDHAMSVTNAERGLLLEADHEGMLTVRLARGSGGTALARREYCTEPDRAAAGGEQACGGHHRRFEPRRSKPEERAKRGDPGATRGGRDSAVCRGPRQGRWQ